MKVFNFFLGFVFLLMSVTTMQAQFDPSIKKEIEKIDSLLVYNQFDLAENKVDSLHLLLNTNNNAKYREQKLTLRLQKGIVLEEKFEFNKSLSIFLEVLSEAESYKLNKLSCQANIYIASNHETNANYENAYRYLKAASEQCQAFHLDELYSTLLIRSASLRRAMQYDKEQAQRLEKIGFKFDLDSAMNDAAKAIEYAQKYQNIRDVIDGNLLLGIFYISYKGDKDKGIEYFLKVIPNYQKINDFEGEAMMYGNVSRIYLEKGDGRNALKYSNWAYQFYNKLTYAAKSSASHQKATVFGYLNQTDSAYHYMQIALKDLDEFHNKQKSDNTKKLEEEYQNDKKEETIKNKNRQMALIIGLLLVIAFATVLIISKNRKINAQNKVISNQLIDLKKVLEQKQILLSELQHRVKNNLQYVISILEMQKESVNFSNIDDLIKNNQNRIYSIALLHKKLNVNESVNDVDLKMYIDELSQLVKDSYDNPNKNIGLYITCELKSLTITKALPIGLIIVELVSNSMKHAFAKQPKGVISIDITTDEKAKMNKLHYVDNGVGFDMHNTKSKGLGLEIISGLIDQLDATVETHHNNGFELIIYFK